MGNVVFGTIIGTIKVDIQTEEIVCKVQPFRMNMLFDDKIESVALMLATAQRKCIPRKKEKKNEFVERIFAHSPPDMVKILDNGFKMFDSFIRSSSTSVESQAGDALASLVRRSETSRSLDNNDDDDDEDWGDWGDWGNDENK